MRVWMCLLPLAGCSEYGLGPDVDSGPDARVDIEVVPMRLDFGGVELGGEGATASFEVRNVGLGRLEVDPIQLPDAAFTVVDGAGPFGLGPGESRSVDVRFVPQAPGEAFGTASIFSNDPDESLVEVALTGSGRGPWLVLVPSLHDFGTAAIPCPDQVDVVMQNVGDAPVDVQEVSWTSDPQLTWTPEQDGAFTLLPGQFSAGTVRLDPVETGSIQGLIEVRSNDPRGSLLARQVATPRRGELRSDSARVPANPPVDMVVAVDRSASMDDDADRLGESFEAFITELERVTDDWKLGVVTLDSGCFNGGVITAKTADAAGIFRRAVKTGEDRTIADDEALFSLTERALGASELGRCNAGFRRENAALHIIVVSDEPERSTDRAASLTWDHFVTRWADTVPTRSLLKVSGVLDLDGCGGGADGYVQAIEDTGGIPLSLCGTDWSAAATELARATWERLVRVPLSQQPVVSSLVVTADGEPTEFTYDPLTNAVVVGGSAAGAAVEATYSVAAECP